MVLPWDFHQNMSSRKKIKVKLDKANYAIKSDLRNTTGVDTSEFAKRIELAS